MIPAAERANTRRRKLGELSLSLSRSAASMLLCQPRGHAPCRQVVRRRQTGQGGRGAHVGARCQLSRVSRSSWLSSCATGRRAPSFPIAHLIHQMRREILPRDSSSHLTGDVDPPNVRSALFPWCSIYLGPPSIGWPLGEGHTIRSCSAVSTDVHAHHQP